MRNSPKLEQKKDIYADEDDDLFMEYVPVGLDGVLASTEKLLAVNRGLQPVDKRDILPFNRVYTTDQLLAERVKMDEGHYRRKLLRTVAKQRSLSKLAPNILGPQLEEHILNDALSSPGEETNPIFSLGQQMRMTKIGRGGLGDRNAITDDLQAVHASQFGFIDPIAGPESELGGVDVRLARGAKVGLQDGQVYQELINKRTGKKEWVSSQDLMDKTVGIS